MRPPRTPHQDPAVRAAETWFIDNGVPHFLEHYRATERWRSLITPLVVLVAFELGMAPWTFPSLFQLLTAPPLVLCAVASWRMYFDARPWGTSRRDLAMSLVRLVFHLALMVGFSAAVGYYVASSGLDIGLTNETVNALVLLLLFAASVLLLRPAARLLPDRRALPLLWGAEVAVVVFALEGTLLPPAWQVWREVPQATPALLAAVPLAYASWRAARTPVDDAGPPTTGGLTAVPAVPILLCVLAVETTIFPHTSVDPSAVAIGALGIAVGTAIWAAVRRGTSRSAEVRARRWQVGTWIVGGILLAISLLAYPVIVLFYGSIHVNPVRTDVVGLHAFTIAFLVHVGYLALTVLVVSFGLDRLAAWAAREARRHARNIGSGIAEGMPLLLVFVTFFTFSQETWQVAHLASPTALFALLGVLLFAVLLVVLWTAATRVAPRQSYDLSNVDELATTAAGKNADLLLLVQEWRWGLRSHQSELAVLLKGKSRVNAVAVLAIYECLILIPLTLFAASVLFLICKLTVKPGVAAGWIFGDGEESRGAAWEGQFFAQPWLRVAAVLAVFALLYVAVEVHRDQAQASRFFAGAQNLVDMRLAMYAVYVARLSSVDGTPPAGAVALPERNFAYDGSAEPEARVALERMTPPSPDGARRGQPALPDTPW